MFIERNTKEWTVANDFVKQQRMERIELDLLGEFEIVEDIMIVRPQEVEFE